MFQVMLAAFFVLVAVLAITATVRNHTSPAVGMFWLLAAVGGGLLTLYPDAVTTVANRLGIGRGVNLLLYCAIVAGFVGFLMMYIRVRRVRAELTLLVRRLAIMEAEARLSPDERADRTA